MPNPVYSNPEKNMAIRGINKWITTLSVPFARFGYVNVGGRATLVRMENGSVAVFSPVALTQDVKDAVSRLGELKYITALDFEHHIHLGAWHEEYPNAKVIGVEGLADKRKKQKNEEVPFHVVFTEANRFTQKVDPEFDNEFDYTYMPSHQNKELIFLHKPSRTLIEADLLFNLPAIEQYSRTDIDPTKGIFTRLFVSLTSTQGAALGQKRLFWYALSAGQKKGWSETASIINKWDFDAIVPCHGNVIETDGKSIFQKIFEWHLEGAKKSN